MRKLKARRVAYRTPSANGKLCSRRRGRSSSWITKLKRLAIYLRDRFTCQYCGVDLHSAAKHMITLDHLECRDDHPTGKLPNGLSIHHESNLVTACLACNSGRASRQKWSKYATQGAKQRIRRTVRRKLPLDLARAILSGDTRMVDAVESTRR